MSLSDSINMEDDDSLVSCLITAEFLAEKKANQNLLVARVCDFAHSTSSIATNADNTKLGQDGASEELFKVVDSGYGLVTQNTSGAGNTNMGGAGQQQRSAGTSLSSGNPGNNRWGNSYYNTNNRQQQHGGSSYYTQRGGVGGAGGYRGGGAHGYHPQNMNYGNNFNTNRYYGNGMGMMANQTAVDKHRDWSLPVSQNDDRWKLIEELPFSDLTKSSPKSISADSVSESDLLWCGELIDYDKSNDRIMSKSGGVDLKPSKASLFNVTTWQDPVLQQLLQKETKTDDSDNEQKSSLSKYSVATTDKVLSALMACTKSASSWDVIVSKIGNTFILDIRDGSRLHLQSVYETSDNPPDEINLPTNPSSDQQLNSATKLSQESTSINFNFSQQSLSKTSEVEKMQYPNPFRSEDETDVVASGAYRYRKFSIKDVTIKNREGEVDHERRVTFSFLVRTEVNSKMLSSSVGKVYVSLRCLSEYTSGTGSLWKSKLDAQRSSTLLNEIRHNSFKFSRWVIESTLAGCSTMKVGFAARKTNDSSKSHSLLGVETLKVDEISRQAGVLMTTAWAHVMTILKTIINSSENNPNEDEEGPQRYLVIKDPKKPAMRIYSVDWQEFERDIEGEEEEDDEDEGNRDEI